MRGSEPAHHSAPESSGRGLPREDPAALAQELLDVPVDVVEHALQTKLTDGTVVADTSVGRVCMFLSSPHALVLVNDRSPS